MAIAALLLRFIAACPRPFLAPCSSDMAELVAVALEAEIGR